MDDTINIDTSKKIFRATFDVEGFPIGFYPDDIWPVGYPDDAIEISEAQWFEFISNAGLRKWQNGEVVEFVPPSPPEPEIRVSSRQFKIQLVRDEMYRQVEDWVLSEGEEAIIAWNHASTFVMSDTVMQEGFANFGFTDEQIRAFFARAALV